LQSFGFIRILKTITLLFNLGLLSNNTFAQKVYSADADYKVDKKIYLIDNDYQAKWNKSDKKHKMY
tara:strand:- start:225 stop:422 length:198 start_codon:yes stop_codon:yes gene_type:complete